MNSKEAKDFLVQETARQATIQKVPLSDLEKRMMYFTEQDDSCENPVRLNEEFDAQCDRTEYEKKLGGLLLNTYARLRKEDPAAAQRWEECIRVLAKGDHYISVLWDFGEPHDRTTYNSLKLFLAGMLLATILLSAAFLADHLGFKSPLLQRLVFYPLVLLISWFLVKRLGRKGAKP